MKKVAVVLGFVVLLFFGFSAIFVWAQTNNNPVRITISGISDFNGWEGRIFLLTSRNIDDDSAYVAEGYQNNTNRIMAGSATFALTDDNDGKPFTRSGRYYVMIHVMNTVNRREIERFFVSKNQINITGGTQHIAFNYDVFFEAESEN